MAFAVIWVRQRRKFRPHDQIHTCGTIGRTYVRSMNLISAEELKAKLDRSEDFKLVMAVSDWAFQISHIPGSLNSHSPRQAAESLRPDDEIVVYCSCVQSIASLWAYRFSRASGCKNVRRFAGGLMDWDAHGYPLEGSSVGAG